MANLLTAIGLVIFIEGLIYGGFPTHIKKMALQIQEFPDSFLRIFGIIAMIIGVIIVWLVH